MTMQVRLTGSAPWGFRLVGGKDFSQPLTISRITPGSKAALAGMVAGDVILSIEGSDADDLTHLEAQNKIKACGDDLTLNIRRQETKLWSPNVQDEEGRVHPFKVNLEAEQQDSRQIGSGYNRRARPFIAHSDVEAAKQIVNAQYNTPLHLYSNDNLQHTVQGQFGGSPEPDLPSSPPPRSPMPRTPTINEAQRAVATAAAAVGAARRAGSSSSGGEVDTESDVYKMLLDITEVESQPKQSTSFRFLQDMLEYNGDKPERPTGTRTVRAPNNKLGPISPPAQKLPICGRCDAGIVGTVVKVRDQLRHPECFVCADCGACLKQKGYFFVEGDMYCEVHARARVKPPEGYEVVAVFPNN
ncbi:PDZ and LIM domain protein 3-like [Lampetra fluviatilis]